MRKRITLFVATLLVLAAASFGFLSPSKAGAQGASCQAQCKVSYMKCVNNATNPGGLNQCAKANKACLAGCN